MLTILYRDQHLIAIHKPAGLLVHRTDLNRNETQFALQMLRDQIGKMVWPVHRLDRGTSGVLLFALDQATLALAAKQFERAQVAKTYLAVVRGWPAEQGCIDHPLARIYDTHEGQPDEAAPPQTARTRFERLGTVELPVMVDRYPTSRYALLRLFPETGRRHQIRRHLKHIAHPVIGDATYGKGIHNRMFQERFGCKRLLLTCLSMELTHPYTGEPLLLRTQLDEDFTTLACALGWTDAVHALAGDTRPPVTIT